MWFYQGRMDVWFIYWKMVDICVRYFIWGHIVEKDEIEIKEERLIAVISANGLEYLGKEWKRLGCI